MPRKMKARGTSNEHKRIDKENSYEHDHHEVLRGGMVCTVEEMRREDGEVSLTGVRDAGPGRGDTRTVGAGFTAHYIILGGGGGGCILL